MKIASLLAVVLAAVPAFAAGRGHSRAARPSRLTLSRPAFGRPSYAFNSFSRTRFASHSTFTGTGARASSFSSGSRASRANSSGSSAVTGNVPTNVGSTASRGNWGTPTSGTMNNGTTIGGSNGGGTQTVAGGEIAPGPGAVDSNRSPGVTWGAPSAPVGGQAGGNGATTNTPNTGF